MADHTAPAKSHEFSFVFSRDGALNVAPKADEHTEPVRARLQLRSCPGCQAQRE